MTHAAPSSPSLGSAFKVSYCGRASCKTTYRQDIPNMGLQVENAIFIAQTRRYQQQLAGFEATLSPKTHHFYFVRFLVAEAYRYQTEQLSKTNKVSTEDEKRDTATRYVSLLKKVESRFLSPKGNGNESAYNKALGILSEGWIFDQRYTTGKPPPSAHPKSKQRKTATK